MPDPVIPHEHPAESSPLQHASPDREVTSPLQHALELTMAAHAAILAGDAEAAEAAITDREPYLVGTDAALLTQIQALDDDIATEARALLFHTNVERAAIRRARTTAASYAPNVPYSSLDLAG